MERIHEKLFSFYNKIDFDRIRWHSEEPQPDSEVADETFALSCQELAAREEPAEVITPERTVRPRRIRSIRFDTFLRVLEQKLGCEVRPGKGSEVVVYRQGGKLYRLGHHREVYSWTVQNVLNRLKIPLSEWFSVVYK